MKENKENFDDALSRKIKSAFETHQEPYDATLWQALKPRLEEVNGRKGILPFWRKSLYLLMLSVLIGLGSIAVFFLDSSKSSQKSPVAKLSEPQDTTTPTNKKSYRNYQNNKASNSLEKSESAQTQMPLTTETELTKGDKLSQKNLLNQPSFPVSQKSSHNLNNSYLADNEWVKQSIATEIQENQVMPIAPLSHQAILQNIDSLTPLAITPVITQEDSSKTEPHQNCLQFALLLQLSKGFSDPSYQLESPLSLGLGVGCSFFIAKKWQLQTGILLQSYQWQRKASGLELLARSSFDAANFSVLALEGNYDLSLHTLWLEVPLDIRYTLLKKKRWALSAFAGLSSYFYLKEKYTSPEIVAETVQVQNPSTGEISEQSRNTFTEISTRNAPLSRVELFNTARLGLSVELALYQKYRLAVNPYYQFSLSKMTQLELNTHFVGLGLQFDLPPFKKK